MTGSSLLPFSASVSRFLDAVTVFWHCYRDLLLYPSFHWWCVCVPSLVFAISATRCFFCSLCHSHTRCPKTLQWYSWLVLTRQLQFLRDVSASSVTHPPGAPLLGLMPAGFKNHLLFKTVQNTPLPFTARMPRRRNKQSGNRILTALRRLRIKIEPRSRVLLILSFKCKQIMKCKRIMKSDMSQYKERVELFSI